MYDNDESQVVYAKHKYLGELSYPYEENQWNEEIVALLLSIFDSLRIAYKIGKVDIQITLSSVDSITNMYKIYQRLHEEGRLNPFILFLLSKGRSRPSASTPYVAFQYQPDAAELSGMEANREEFIFIQFVQEQLALSPSFVFYCVGWSEEDVTASTEMKKLAKYFKKIFFLSTPNNFLSQIFVISNG